MKSQHDLVVAGLNSCARKPKSTEGGPSLPSTSNTPTPTAGVALTPVCRREIFPSHAKAKYHSSKFFRWHTPWVGNQQAGHHAQYRIDTPLPAPAPRRASPYSGNPSKELTQDGTSAHKRQDDPETSRCCATATYPESPSRLVEDTPAEALAQQTALPVQPIKSILREAPKASLLVRKPEESSLPSLVGIQEDSDDDDEASQSSKSNHDGDNRNPGTHIEPVDRENSQRLGGKSSKETGVVPCSYGAESEKASADSTEDVMIPRRIAFDPRVWVREFHRSPHESASTWYTSKDMESFKKLAVERILWYQSTTDIIGTGTGRTIQRSSPTRRRGPIYSHAALTLDGEIESDIFMRKRVLEKELSSILIVDPHDLCLQLLSKTIKRALSKKSYVVTATSSKEALQLLEQGERFDMIIVEERLRLFRQSAMSGKVDTAVAAKRSGGNVVSSGAALLDRFSRSQCTRRALLIGMSAHMKEDRALLQSSGADFCWPKPPPPIDEKLVDDLVKTLLIKRNRTALAAELYG